MAILVLFQLCEVKLHKSMAITVRTPKSRSVVSDGKTLNCQGAILICTLRPRIDNLKERNFTDY